MLLNPCGFWPLSVSSALTHYPAGSLACLSLPWDHPGWGHTLCAPGLPTHLSSTSYLVSVSMPSSLERTLFTSESSPILFCGPFFLTMDHHLEYWCTKWSLTSTHSELHDGKMMLVFLSCVSLGTDLISEADQRLSKHLLNEWAIELIINQLLKWENEAWASHHGCHTLCCRWLGRVSAIDYEVWGTVYKWPVFSKSLG